MRRGGLIALASLLGYVLLGLPFIVFPRVAHPVPHADVVLVLGPISEQRIAVAKKLVAEGKASAMLWSIPPASRNPLRPEAALVTDCGTLPNLTCDYASPSTTEGEGRMLAREAKRHGWNSAIVVTMTPHITRSRMILTRCFSGPIAMVPSGEPAFRGWIYQYLYQTSATVKAWLSPGC